MAQSKTIIIISGMVDATIREYQPDVDFKMFRNLNDFNEFLEHDPIRAQILFITNDATGRRASSFSLLKDILQTNDYVEVDRVIYLTDEDAPELSALRFLMDEANLTNWEIIQGNMNRSFVQEVINGTFREDNFVVNRKVVIRKPRTDYVKQQLRHREALNEAYIDDEHDLLDIPDEVIPDVDIIDKPKILDKVFIASRTPRERAAFAVLAAQYLSKTSKVLLVESDPDYHIITEYVTKSKIDCAMFTVTDIYNDLTDTLNRMREVSANLVVLGCIDRIPFDYRYIISLLYYNLLPDYDYLITELNLDEIPENTNVTVVMPSTIPDVLATGECIDKSSLPYVQFVGIDMKDIPEVHVSSGLVLGKILDDVLTDHGISCPVITVSSLRLGDTAYDLGGVLRGGTL